MAEIIKETIITKIYDTDELLANKEGAELRIAEVTSLINDLKLVNATGNLKTVIDEKILDYEERIKTDEAEINNINELLA